MANFEDIKKAFRKAVDSDPDVRKIYADLQDLPTYANAMRLANKIGEDLGKVLVKYAPELSVDDLELADILPKALGLDHAQVSAACKEVQEKMNRKAGLGIKYKEPQFNMDKAHSLSSPMVVRSLDLEKDPFGPKKPDEDMLGPEIPYLSAIGALMYFASHTRPDISFAVS